MLVTKYGQQHDTTHRRAAKKAHVEHVEGTWEAPDEGSCRVDEFPVFPGSTTRITLHYRYQGTRLVYFAMMHDALDGDSGEWKNVARVDCKHKSVHLHRFNRTGLEVGSPQILLPLHSEEDVNAAFDSAYSLIFDNVGEHERTWRND